MTSANKTTAPSKALVPAQPQQQSLPVQAPKQTALAPVSPQISALYQQFPEDKFNLLLPKTHIMQLPEGTQPSVREVVVDVRSETGRNGPIYPAKEVYAVDGGGLGLSKVTLDKISAAAGIVWERVERTDNRQHPHYCEFTAVARVADLDGTVRQSIGNKTLDLRDKAEDGSPGKDRATMGDKQLAQARKFITEICASKAMNRAISSVLAIKRAYTAEELRKPFIVVKLTPDTNHAKAQEMVLAGLTGNAALLYGRQEAPARVIDVSFDDVEPPTDQAPQSSLSAPVGEVGGEQSPPTSEPAGGYDLQTGEVRTAPTGTRDVIDLIKSAWAEAKEVGMTPDGFRQLCRINTGVDSKDKMTLAHAQAVAQAVLAYKESSADGADMPV